MNTLVARWMATALAVGGLVLFVGAPASAHEPRTEGPLRFVVGWGDEPTYTGFKNSVQVTIADAGGAPVTDLGDTLKVEVIKGADRLTLPLVANFRVGGPGTPGDYRAWLTPTRPGSYTFRLFGTAREQKVDQSFTSSKTTFNDVEDVSAIAFPSKDPSTGQLATRIDREVPRLEAALRRAEDDAAGARTVGMVGVGVGALGLLAAVLATVGVRSSRGGRPGQSSPEFERPVSEMARPKA